MKHLSILLIDDDLAANFLHRIIIEDSPYEVSIHEFLKAQRGLDYIVDHLKDEENKDGHQTLLLLDINMPEMNGWEFLEEFESLSSARKSGIVIVMLTTSMNPDDRLKSETIKFVKGFYNKPLKESMLKEIIDKHFPSAPRK